MLPVAEGRTWRQMPRWDQPSFSCLVWDAFPKPSPCAPSHSSSSSEAMWEPHLLSTEVTQANSTPGASFHTQRTCQRSLRCFTWETAVLRVSSELHCRRDTKPKHSLQASQHPNVEPGAHTSVCSCQLQHPCSHAWLHSCYWNNLFFQPKPFCPPR